MSFFSKITTYTIPIDKRIPTIILALLFICKFHNTQIGKIPKMRSVIAAHEEYAIAIA